MVNIFLIALIIAIVFLVIKFIEMRFIDKESKPLKLLIRDALLVYLSVVAGYFILEQLKPVIQNGGTDIINTPVFTDNPGF
jgi:hypothetical protein